MTEYAPNKIIHAIDSIILISDWKVTKVINQEKFPYNDFTVLPGYTDYEFPMLIGNSKDDKIKFLNTKEEKTDVLIKDIPESKFTCFLNDDCIYIYFTSRPTLNTSGVKVD